VAQEDCKSHETGEPEDHRQALDTTYYAGVVELAFREEHRYDDQVGESDQSDYRAEQKEADRRWRAGMPVGRPPVGNCMCWLATPPARSVAMIDLP
jgi:hypothetical protein